MCTVSLPLCVFDTPCVIVYAHMCGSDVDNPCTIVYACVGVCGEQTVEGVM